MSNSTSDKTGLPAWFLILAVGGIAGLVLGAVFFFSGDDHAASAAAAASANPSSASPAAGANAASPKPAAPSTALTQIPTSIEGWNEAIASANVESYPALMDGVLRIADPAMQAKVAEALILKWLNTDRETYLVYLDQLETSADEGKKAWPVLVPAFVKAVPQLGEAAASSPDLEEAVQWMTDYYAELDPPAALEWTKKWLLGDAQQTALSTIAGQLAKTSLPQAEELARSLQSPSARVDAIANIASQLGAADPQKALAWAQGLKDADEKATAVEEVMWAMADKSPDVASQQILRLNDPELLQNVGGTIAESLAAQDPQKGLAWAESIPAGPARDDALVGALSGWASKDPQAAFSYFQSKQAGNAAAAQGLFEQWATNDPKVAAQQAAALANPQARAEAYTGVVNGWLNSASPDSVEQWVDQLPAGRERDVASATLVDALGVDDPQSAWDRALTIKDSQVRTDAVMSAFSALAQSDEAAARQALQSANLPAAEKSQLEPVLRAVAGPGGQGTAVAPGASPGGEQ